MESEACENPDVSVSDSPNVTTDGSLGESDASPVSQTGKGKRKPKVSQSCRAGLIFPVSRVKKQLKQESRVKRVGSEAAVYMAAVGEYLIAEVADLAGSAAKSRKRERIQPRDISRAIRMDVELKALLGKKDDTSIVPSAATATQTVHPELLPKKKKKLFNAAFVEEEEV